MKILILILIFLLVVVLFFIVLIYLVNKKYSVAHVNYDTVKTWNDESTDLFNRTYYMNCLNSINFVYNLYADSVTKTNTILGDIIKQVQINFLVEDMNILFSQSSITNRLRKVPLLNLEYYTPFGMIGKIQNSRTGIISFRGTTNVSEWAKDFSSFTLKAFSNLPKSTKNVGTMVALTGMDNISSDLKVGNGWLNIYTNTPGQQTDNNCVCSTNCKNNTCRIVYPNRIGKIAGITECSGPNKPCGLLLCNTCENDAVGDPICKKVFDYVSSHEDDIDDYIICGHSLGAAVATICAFHIANVFPGKVKCLYSFASPMIGNQSFAKSFNPILEDKTFRIANVNDSVPYLPGSTPGKKENNLVKQYENVANTCYTFDQVFPGEKKYSPYYHLLNESYKKSYDTIVANLSDPSYCVQNTNI